MLKMSSAIDAAFSLSMSPFVVSLSPFIIQRRGKVCLSIDFRFVTQYLVHSNGIINVFTYFIFNQSYRRGLVSPFSYFFLVLFHMWLKARNGSTGGHVFDRNRTPLHMEP